MAQPSQFIYDYLAGMYVSSGVTYSSSDILTAYPTAKVIELRTDDVGVSINGTDAIKFNKGDVAYINTSRTWVFTKDCTVAIAALVDLTV